MTKTCFKCTRELPLSEFYTHPRMADGHLGKCKTCTRSDTETRRREKESDPQWVESELERHREKSRIAREAGTVKPINPEKKRETMRRHKAKFPEKDLARRLCKAAIKAGILVRQPCHCGAEAEAHHDDYSKPLTVTWLCPKHHGARHVELRKIQRQKATQTQKP